MKIAGEKSKVTALGNLLATFVIGMGKVKVFPRVSQMFLKKETSWCRILGNVLILRIRFNFKFTQPHWLIDKEW